MIPSLSAANQPAASQTAKLRDAAQQFEALFVSQLMRSAREASQAESSDQTSEVMMEVAEEQIALALSRQGGLGLAQSVLNQIQATPSTSQNTKTPEGAVNGPPASTNSSPR